MVNPPSMAMFLQGSSCASGPTFGKQLAAQARKTCRGQTPKPSKDWCFSRDHVGQITDIRYLQIQITNKDIHVYYIYVCIYYINMYKYTYIYTIIYICMCLGTWGIVFHYMSDDDMSRDHVIQIRKNTTLKAFMCQIQCIHIVVAINDKFKGRVCRKLQN